MSVPGAQRPDEAGRVGATHDEVAAQILGELPAALLDAKSVVEESLRGRRRGISAEALDPTENIQGVAVGVGLPTGRLGQVPTGGAPGDPVLTVYLTEPAPAVQLRSVMAHALGVRAATLESEVPMYPVVTGYIDAQPHRLRLRPTPAGNSIGHYRTTAGTLGSLAVGRSEPRASRLFILSNNHVLANMNEGRAGDCICQPAPYDGGTCPADQIGVLEQFVPLKFDGEVNYIDCATAWAWPERVRRDLLQISNGLPSYYQGTASPVTPLLGMTVGKSGRTTQVTTGRISALGASVWVNYSAGRSAYFEDQIAIQGLDTDFSSGGDSGSLVWTWDSARSPVGLLFAGGGAVSFANRLPRVLDALDITLWSGGPGQ